MVYSKQEKKEHYERNKNRLLKQQKEYYQKNREKKIKYQKEYANKNKKKIKEYKKEYHQKNKEKIKRDKEEWGRKHPNYMKGYNKNYYQKNREKVKKQVKKYREKNREKVKKYHRKYRKDNEEEIRRKKAEWEKKNLKEVRKKRRDKYKTNKNFKIIITLRNSLVKALKLYTKTGKIYSSKQYGVDYKAIIEHLKPFPKDLSRYEIHHIKPLYTFNFINKDGSTNLKEVKEAFAPKNHKLVTIKEHYKIHKKIGNNMKKWLENANPKNN